MATDAILQVHYPDSDGQPMGESDLHRNWMNRIIEMLQAHFRGQRTYVTGNLFFYYVEGDPSQVLAPDAMVVKDCDPAFRRSYRLWDEEERLPCFVLETTSASTRSVDLGRKWQLYASLGIAEYFLFDPTGDYIPGGLQGHRLVDGAYQPITANAQGRLDSRELGLQLGMEDGILALWSTETGEQLLTGVEWAEVERQRAAVERQRAEAERTRAEAERARASLAEEREAAAQQRAAEGEAEVARLSAELERLRSRDTQ